MDIQLLGYLVLRLAFAQQYENAAINQWLLAQERRPFFLRHQDLARRGLPVGQSVFLEPGRIVQRLLLADVVFVCLEALPDGIEDFVSREFRQECDELLWAVERAL